MIGEGLGVELRFTQLGFTLAFSGDGITLINSSEEQLLYVSPAEVFIGGE